MKPSSNDAKRQKDWGNILFLTLSPIIGIGGTIWYVFNYGIHWMDITAFLFLYILTAGMGISAGYHRLFSHRSYDCHWSLKFFYLLCGAAALQNSALRWSRDHRVHHQHIDQDEDPYNITKGAFHAHVGWILYKNPHEEDFSNVPDLTKSKLILWQDRYYILIAAVVGFGLPTLMGWAVGRPLGGLLWGGILRTVLVHHLTFFINSLAHMVGDRPFTEKFSARDSWWLAFLTYGEGFHNFHHRFASDYRNSYHWYHWDPTKWWVNFVKSLGLVSRITQYRKDQLLKARIETDIARVHRQIQAIPGKIIISFEQKLQEARQKLEAAAERWEQAMVRYEELKKSAALQSSRTQEAWKIRLRDCRLQLEAAQNQWKALLIAAGRLAQGQTDF